MSHMESWQFTPDRPPFFGESHHDFERAVREEVLAPSSLALRNEKLVLEALGESAETNGILDFLHQLAEQDPRTYAHIMRVSSIGTDLALEKGMEGQAIKDFALSLLVHDLGKEKIPQEILHKSGSLSPEETITLHNHPAEGLETLRTDPRFEKIAKNPMVQAVMLGHHGSKKSGPYPVDLSRPETFREGQFDIDPRKWSPEIWDAIRLATASDTLDALSSHDRSYHSGIDDPSEVARLMHQELVLPDDLVEQAVSRLKKHPA